jgi:hypothetical protein
VARVAGPPGYDSRERSTAAPDTPGPVLWFYYRSDPGGATGLQVTVRFEGGKVVEVRREPCNRG